MAQQSADNESYNRVFVLGGKDCSKDEFKEVFGKYGEVKDIWMVSDRKSGDFKGVTYITYSKASEAALAIEELNGKHLGSSPKTLKVLLANDKKEGSVRDPKEGERMMRLFIIVQKKQTDDDIRAEFEKYGKVEYVRLIKDRKTGSAKGLAYVKYFRAYHAALALEQCDQNFRAVFAVPPGSQKSDQQKWDDYGYYNNDRSSDRMAPRGFDNGRDSRLLREYGPPSSHSLLGGGMSSLGSMSQLPAHSSQHGHQSSSFGFSPLQKLLKSYPTEGTSTLEVMAAPGVTQQQLYGLLDMTPGLEYCELEKDSGVAYAQYKTAQLAAYAKDKLGFVEFPPGFRIAVRFPQAVSGSLQEVSSTLSSSLQNIESGNIPENLETLVQSIKKATDILQRAGVSGASSTQGNAASGGSEEERLRYCSIPLPLPRAVVSKDLPCAQRLFIVSQPESFPQEYLQDVLCRFGGLQDAFFMPGKNFGYAKFTSAESAEQAINSLHGQQVCHMRLKVMKAEPRKYEKDGEMKGDAKRPRLAFSEESME